MIELQPLMRPIRPAWTALLLLAAYAAQAATPPVPVWTGVGALPVALAGHRVFLTPDLHTMVVLVNRDPQQIVRVPLMNDFDPQIGVDFTRESGTQFRYHYALTNGRRAKDAMGTWSVTVDQHDDSLMVDKPTDYDKQWPGVFVKEIALAKQAVFRDAPLGKDVYWVRPRGQELQPGESRSEFTIHSNYLPGLTTAWMGTIKLPAIDQDWPPEILRDTELIVDDRLWRERFLIVAGPAFGPSTSRGMAAKTTLGRVRDMISAGLLSPSHDFVKQAIAVLEAVPVKSDAALRVDAPAETPEERALALVLRETLGVRTHE